MNLAECTAAEKTVRERGGAIVLRVCARLDRTYGLVELAAGDDAALAAAVGATSYETAIIALAVFPERREALPFLLQALAGEGRPSGVVDCIERDGGVVVEWDPRRVSADVVTGLIEVEMRRFGGSRTAELLSPLPDAVIAEIAAGGLQAPEIAAGRVLETLLERAGVAPDV